MSININLKKLHIKSLKGFSLPGPSRTPGGRGRKPSGRKKGKSPRKRKYKRLPLRGKLIIMAAALYSMTGAFRGDGYYNIYAGVSHDKVRDAIGGIREELEILGEKGITEEELDSSREQLKASYIFGQENVAGRMFKNGKNTLLTGNVQTDEAVIAAFDAVDMDAIRQVSSMICDFSQYSAALVTRDRLDLARAMKG